VHFPDLQTQARVDVAQDTLVGSILRNLGLAGDADSARLEVTVTAGRVIAYASVNDNRTGDGTCIEATKGQ
jgi:hypothetical protein